MNFMYSHWLNLSLPTRNKIASEFGIEKKGSTEVYNNTIKSDGYHVKDIEEKLTLEKIKEYLKTTEQDSIVLWNYLIDKMEGRDIQILEPVPFVEEKPVVVEEPKKETYVKNKKSNTQK